MSSAIPISLRSPTASSNASNISSLCTGEIDANDNLNYKYPIPPNPNRLPEFLKSQ